MQIIRHDPQSPEPFYIDGQNVQTLPFKPDWTPFKGFKPFPEKDNISLSNLRKTLEQKGYETRIASVPDRVDMVQLEIKSRVKANVATALDDDGKVVGEAKKTSPSYRQ